MKSTPLNLIPLPDDLADIIECIFQRVEELRCRFPGKRFTPGDKLIGDTGETLAEKLFDLELLNTKTHDFLCRRTKLKVQVKTTSGDSIGLGLTRARFEHLLVFKLYPTERAYELLYDGPGECVWNATERKKSNSIRANLLRKLQGAHDKQLPRRAAETVVSTQESLP